MTPLEVTARLRGPIVMPGLPPALDALAAAAVATERGLQPPTRSEDVEPLDVPIALSNCGRFRRCTVGQFVAEAHELRYKVRQFPMARAQGMAELKRVQVNAGASKSYRVPYSATHLEGDTMRWWCVGEPDELARLLALVTHLGKHRGAGNGRVMRWSIEPCEPWGEGFPIVREGAPTRTLPADWPGLESWPHVGPGNLMPPYWMAETEEECLLPLS